MSTLSLFRADSHDTTVVGGNSAFSRAPNFEEPTRDPDVWPPAPFTEEWPQPTPADLR